MSSSPSPSRLQGGPERRRHIRCRVLERQLVTVGLGPDRRGLLVDISESGAAVQPYTELQTGDTSPVQFQLPGSSTRIEAQGVVSWVGPTGRAGIRFTNVAEDAHEQLRRWIDGLAPAAPSSSSTTAGAALATAAYLPPSFSPWIRMSETRVEPSRLDNDVADLDLVSALRLVVERSRTVTRASGAAIALADKEEMVCRARTGVAPDLGARFRPDSGLSGEAVRTAKTVRCIDTGNDERVDRLACERLNVRSIVITPVLSSAAVIGVIEVFSPKPRAFDDRDELHLRRMADLVAAMLENNVGHLEMGFLPDLEEPVVPAELSAPSAPAPNVAAQSVSPEPQTTASTTTAVVSAPEYVPDALAEIIKSHYGGVPDTTEPAGLGIGRYPLVPSETSSSAIAVAEPPSRNIALDAPPPSPEQVEDIYNGFMQQASEEDRRMHRKAMIIVLLSLALLAALLTVPFFLMRKKARVAPPVPQRLAPTSSMTAPPAVVEPAVELPVPTAKPTASVPQPAPKSGGVQTKARGERWSFLAPTKPGTGSELKLESPQPSAPEPAPEMTSAPGQVKVINDMVGSWGEADPGASDSHIMEGKLINRVDPIFPLHTKRPAARGRVVVRIGIDKAGRVERTEPVSGDPTFTSAAVQAIKQWRYEPYQLDGEPIAVEKTITIDFSSQR